MQWHDARHSRCVNYWPQNTVLLYISMHQLGSIVRKVLKVLKYLREPIPEPCGVIDIKQYFFPQCLCLGFMLQCNDIEIWPCSDTGNMNLWSYSACWEMLIDSSQMTSIQVRCISWKVIINWMNIFSIDKKYHSWCSHCMCQCWPEGSASVIHTVHKWTHGLLFERNNVYTGKNTIQQLQTNPLPAGDII
jgi:hypothetical protein